MKSHQNLTPRQEALAERNLCAALAALRSAEEVRAFLRDLDAGWTARRCCSWP